MDERTTGRNRFTFQLAIDLLSLSGRAGGYGVNLHPPHEFGPDRRALGSSGAERSGDWTCKSISLLGQTAIADGPFHLANARILLTGACLTLAVAQNLTIRMCQAPYRNNHKLVTSTHVDPVFERLTFEEALDVLCENCKYPLGVICWTSCDMRRHYYAWHFP